MKFPSGPNFAIRLLLPYPSAMYGVPGLVPGHVGRPAETVAAGAGPGGAAGMAGPQPLGGRRWAAEEVDQYALAGTPGPGRTAIDSGLRPYT